MPGERRELRYQHAAEIRADLQRLKRDTDSGRVIAKRWKAIVPAAAAVLALSVAGYFYFTAHTSAQQNSRTRT